MIPTATLDRFIVTEERKLPGASGELSDLLSSIGLAVKLISRLVASAGILGMHSYTEETNVQGEIVHRLDQEADEILIQLLTASDHFGSVVSEERDDIISTANGSLDARYIVAFDPLDGSSNIGTNIPVGTIFTIFKRADASKPASIEDYLQPGRKIIAAGYSIYGAMTSFVYSSGNGVHGFTLDPSIGEFVLTERDIEVPEFGSIYSVNEGYRELWDDKVVGCVESFKSSQSPTGKSYSGRYVGSLVADFDRTLRRGGVFMHPANSKRREGKLRMLYECLPLAFIIDQAGGEGSDGKVNILDRSPESIHERCPFYAGGKGEMQWVKKHLE